MGHEPGLETHLGPHLPLLEPPGAVREDTAPGPLATYVAGKRSSPPPRAQAQLSSGSGRSPFPQPPKHCPGDSGQGAGVPTGKDGGGWGLHNSKDGGADQSSHNGDNGEPGILAVRMGHCGCHGSEDRVGAGVSRWQRGWGNSVHATRWGARAPATGHLQARHGYNGHGPRPRTHSG